MPRSSFYPRLLEKIQMLGGARRAESGVLQVRRKEWPSKPRSRWASFSHLVGVNRCRPMPTARAAF